MWNVHLKPEKWKQNAPLWHFQASIPFGMEEEFEEWLTLVMDVNTFSKIALGWALWGPLSWMPRFMAHGLAINLQEFPRKSWIKTRYLFPSFAWITRTWICHQLQNLVKKLLKSPLHQFPGEEISFISPYGNCRQHTLRTPERKIKS